MNKTPIEWCDYTWNPVTGCLHGCPYCYAHRFAERGLGKYGLYEKGHRFDPAFWPERLYEPWSTPVFDIVRQCPQHTFLFLTKDPAVMTHKTRDLVSLKNAWWGVSVDGTKPMRLDYLRKIPGHKFLSLEPLLGEVKIPDDLPVEWIIIGAQTGPGAREHQPSYDRIQSIVWFADRHRIPVFIKNNVIEWPEMRQEYPGDAS